MATRRPRSRPKGWSLRGAVTTPGVPSDGRPVATGFLFDTCSEAVRAGDAESLVAAVRLVATYAARLHQPNGLFHRATVHRPPGAGGNGPRTRTCRSSRRSCPPTIRIWRRRSTSTAESSRSCAPAWATCSMRGRRASRRPPATSRLPRPVRDERRPPPTRRSSGTEPVQGHGARATAAGSPWQTHGPPAVSRDAGWCGMSIAWRIGDRRSVLRGLPESA